MIDEIYKDKCKGILQDEDFVRLSTKNTESRSAIQERIKQIEQQIISRRGRPMCDSYVIHTTFNISII